MGCFQFHSNGYSSDIHLSNMMFFGLVLSCMVAGSLACGNDRCKDPVLANQLLQITFLPNKEELKTFCPKVLNYLECEKNSTECLGQTLDELATSLDKYEASKAKGMLAGIDLVHDVCDENSTIHADYAASVSCYREYFNGDAMNCTNGILKPIEKFSNQYYGDAEEDEGMLSEIRCLRDAYEVACLVDNLGDACGDVAQRTARNAIVRMKDVLGIGSCKTLENAADLKSRFLDFLELDGHRRNNIQGIFDLFKRR